MKSFLEKKLAQLARQIIQKYKPKVIGITGSVGKTSAKEAIFSVVSQKYFTWKSEKNFNTEFGLPYAIIGVKADPGRSVGAWLKLLSRAYRLAHFGTKYPEVLVLEMGVDRPGDMDKLLAIVKPNISVITNISFAHYSSFENVQGIETEKGKLAQVLGDDGYLVLNKDNDKAFAQKDKTKAKVISYSSIEGAEVYLSGRKEYLEEKAHTEIEITTPTRKIKADVKAVGETHISAILAAVSVAEVLRVETDLIEAGLAQYKPQGGRSNIIAGVKHSLILDDSYNASPPAVEAALALLARMPQPKKMAVLGDMLDLGSISDEKHQLIGKFAASLGLDHLITVGPSGKIIAEGARAGGMEEPRILSFDTSNDAKRVVKDVIDQDTVILIKGSQGMRMENVTREIMAEPARAQELLARQYGHWLKS